MKDVEAKIDTIQFLGWESYYKARLKWGVKMMVPVDAIVGIFLTILFWHANNEAYHYFVDGSWRSFFWTANIIAHFTGWAIIAFAKPLSE